MSVLEAYRAKRDNGPYQVAVVEGEWTDADRGGREVPWKIFIPEDGGGPVPIVIWSHGAGGTRDEGSYLGRHIAGHGFAAVQIQHRGTDSEILKAGRSQVLRAVTDPSASADRFRDVAFAISALDSMRDEGALAQRLDTSRIGMAGHSFGAISTMIVAGQHLPPPFGQSLAVPRVRAAMVMSPSVPRIGFRTENSYGRMLVPIFHITGSDDISPMADFPATERRIPFQTIDGVDQYLLVLEGANHMTFSDQTRMFGRDYSYPTRGRHQQLVMTAAVAYWDSRLKDDQRAREWLENGEFEDELGSEGTFDFKPAIRKR